LSSDFDDLFERLFADVGVPKGEPSASVTPRIDVKETDAEVVVEADLPGVDEKDIEVSLHDGVLIVAAERQKASESKDDAGWHRRERVYRSYRRAVPLPVAVDGEKVQASYKAGVLRVTLPKAAEARPRKIEVRAS
jgi:HSP20 family protein